jgi:hypothetical protein
MLILSTMKLNEWVNLIKEIGRGPVFLAGVFFVVLFLSPSSVIGTVAAFLVPD